MLRSRFTTLLLSFAVAACGGSEAPGGVVADAPAESRAAEQLDLGIPPIVLPDLPIDLPNLPIALPSAPGDVPTMPGELPAVPAEPTALPGEFAFRTYVKGTFLTAVGGGGRITDVIHTDATEPRSWERFKLVFDPATSQYAIQTVSGNYLTAVGGGGRTWDVFHTDATQVAGWEKFRFWSQGGIGFHAIQTVSTSYVTALGGGGHVDPPALHTDAARPSTYEWFRVEKCGDLGSDREYAIHDPSSGLFLEARDGGGLTTDPVGTAGPYGNDARFRFVRQPDGSYALQTFDGHYLTALGGGGHVPTLRPDGTYSETLHTDATVVDAWERFWVVDQGDCTYAIQTVDGHWLADHGAGLATDLSSVTPAAKFTLVPFL
jgi:hypothetical protein